MARVLVVDDDLSFRTQVCALLEARYPQVEVIATVADGHAAVAAALAYAPDVVLLDFALPGPDGLHAATVIRRALPNARVVILSGLDRSELDLPAELEHIAKDGQLADALDGVFG